jgi:hypothetical protein
MKIVQLSYWDAELSKENVICHIPECEEIYVTMLYGR